MSAIAVRPTPEHLAAIQAKFVTCYGDDEGHGHPVLVQGDLFWIADDGERKGQGWICGLHVSMGRTSQAARMARWHRVRGGF